MGKGMMFHYLSFYAFHLFGYMGVYINRKNMIIDFFLISSSNIPSKLFARATHHLHIFLGWLVKESVWLVAGNDRQEDFTSMDECEL